MIAFIDIVKALDRVESNTMFRVIRAARIDYGDRRIILQLCRNHRVHIDQSGQQAKISECQTEILLVPANV